MTESDDRCRVVLLNDETPMRVVADVPAGPRLGQIGKLPRDVAEARGAQLTARARSDGHPLRCAPEKE